MNKVGFLTKTEFEVLSSRCFESLIHYQNEFLENNLDSIPNTYKSKWPIDKLSWWSRPFEYKFILDEIALYLKTNKLIKTSFRILEIGPGCSFLTNELLKINEIESYDIIDTDIDVLDFWKSNSEKINVKEINNLSNQFYDIIISVSVFEHINDRFNVLNRISESLRYGGLMLLTLDVDFNSNNQFGMSLDELFNLNSNPLIKSYVKINTDNVFKPLYGYKTNPIKETPMENIKTLLKKIILRGKNHLNIGMYRYKGIK